MRNSKVSLREAILVLVVALAIMGTGVIGLGLSPQVPVLLAITVTIFWAKLTGFSWDEINAGIKDGIDKGIIPIVIFILIGAMISTWIAAGTIPTLMVIGFKAISAQWFLPAVFLVCSLIGAKLSCFTVVSTVGIAFFGIGVTMNFHRVGCRCHHLRVSSVTVSFAIRATTWLQPLWIPIYLIT